MLGMQTKVEFRKEQRQRLIDQADTWQKEKEELALYLKLFATKKWQEAKVVALTLSQPEELDTKPMIMAAFQAGKRVCVPKTLPKRQMVFVELTPEVQITRSKFGVLEPTANYHQLAKDQIDLIVVPGLAYTPTGDRLSFGGGFFDRYLADYPGKTIALANKSRYFTQVQWEVEPTDIQVQEVINLEENKRAN